MRELLGFWKIVSVETYLVAIRGRFDAAAYEEVSKASAEALELGIASGLVRSQDIEAAYTYARERWMQEFDRDLAVAA